MNTKALILAFLLLLFGAFLILAGGCASLDLDRQARAAVRLDIAEGTCSGTVVAQNVILSAGHCFKDDDEDDLSDMPTSMLVNGMEVKILAIVLDGNDHALVRVDFSFPSWVLIGVPPKPGTHVHYWGNPAGINNVYREGYITHYNHSAMMLDVNGFFGDSGAGIFDAFGHVVGVIGFINVSHHDGRAFTLMGADALEFTRQQYVLMGV